ncbi:hemerythrin domain-containing protein [Phenylobacterium sp.]|uniref:hemerythrin domain-containing protein n=1 Tax=Phenylobacterium sp. TaxID=1871053 RepID=UPI002614B3D3|nr:hemerythrin domain-containing protein [Phenylobacterium sp.]
MPETLTTITDIPKTLIKRPLDWFTAEHYRHRQFCALMHGLSRAVLFEPEPIAAVVEFLRHELGRHLSDEEEDLFPLLRARARPEDEVEQVLGRLTAEHRGDMAHGHGLRLHLERCLETHTAPGLDPAAALALDAFATQELRHLALENAVVLPLAKLRLSARDLKALSRRLAARRGLQLQPEAA